jgi:hypothetical protein
MEHLLDRLIRPEIHALHRAWPSFKVCGYSGLALAILLTTGLAAYLGWASWVMEIIILIGMLTFLSLAMLTKIVIGYERLTYYHHQIAVLAMAAFFLWLVRQPMLPYLDATTLGVGLFLACGRVGCLMAGCCYGRPVRWGVRYGPAHVAEGFPACLAGVRLFPIQAIESLWVLGIVLVGAALMVNRQPAGTALAWYIVAYGVGRFCFEFLRGDADRPYWRGFSEAQWTALITVSAVAAAGWGGSLPFQVWHVGAAIGLAAVMIAVALWRRWEPNHLFQLLHPRHIEQIAEALDKLVDLSQAQWVVEGKLPAGSQLHLVPMTSTALGLELSAGYVEREGRCLYHYTLSHRGRHLTHTAAGALGELIVRLRHPASRPEVIPGRQAGIFHVLIGSLV